MTQLLFVIASSALIFMTVVYIALCTSYIMDFCVRFITNDKYAIIHKVK